MIYIVELFIIQSERLIFHDSFLQQRIEYLLVFVFFSQKRGENKVQSLNLSKRENNGEKSCGLHCRAVCTTRNFSEPKNPRFIIKRSFKSRAGYDGAC